jgi:hypothetical protein
LGEVFAVLVMLTRLVQSAAAWQAAPTVTLRNS